jgi:hypothetical protein
VTPPPSRPCGPLSDHGHGGRTSGIVIVLPLGLASLVAGARGRLVARRLRRR